MKFVGALVLFFIIAESQATFLFGSSKSKITNLWKPKPIIGSNKCYNPPKPANGYVKVKKYYLKYKITWGCNNGYKLVGKSWAYCYKILGLKGTSVPTCQRISVKCGRPSIPRNGKINSNKHSFNRGESVTYSCNNGYDLIGTSRVTCGSSGRWSSGPPTCRIRTCRNPGSPTNGRVVRGDKSPFTPGDRITYECNGGYELIGQSTITCGSNGQWSASVPSCSVRKCENPGSPTNGRVVGGDRPPFTPGDQITYGCNRGYELNGQSTITCGANGRWSGSVPTCSAVRCRNPGVPTNGRVIDGDRPPFTFGDSITYDCNRGFELVGLTTINCGSDGRWSGNLPTCRAVTCSEPNAPRNGGVEDDGPFNIGDTATFFCEDGFQLNGKRVITCERDGVDGAEWSDDFPTCERVATCREPTDPINGGVLDDGPFNIGDTATFFCDDDFQLNGEETITCERGRNGDAEWSDRFPTCDRAVVTCRNPGVPTNGRIVGGDRPPFRVDDTIVYGCNKGFELIGDRTITCQSNGRFDGSVPTCRKIYEPVGCSRPSTGQNVVLHPDKRSYPVGFKVKFRCAEPYYPVSGERYSDICGEDGNWKYDHEQDIKCEALYG